MAGARWLSDAKASTVDRAWGGGTGPAAVSLAFVEALGKAAGQKNLKMCFVHKDGYDSTCRSSFDGSMTLVSYPGGNLKLAPYANDKLTYTFGRLAGLAGSADGYDSTKFQTDTFCVPKTTGLQNEFGEGGTGACDHAQPEGFYEGAWNFFGYGISYRPWKADNNELGAGTVNSPNGPVVPDPLPTTYGFRLYIGP